MSTMTGSIRLADLTSSALVTRSTAVAAAATLPAENIADFAKAAVLSVPATARRIPGLEILSRISQALKRPAQPTRTEAEELHEERINTITHALGLVISVGAFAYLLMSAVTSGGWLRVTSCGVYGTSLMAMYAGSTLLHWATNPKLKLRFQLYDHVAIYLLIAGTYTPILASLMQDSLGFALLVCVWLMAAVGIAIKIKYADRLDQTSPLPCVALGWIGLVAMKQLLVVLPPGGMLLLIAGGASFSAGVVFYCRDDKRYFHAIWHLFVLLGTGLHFCTILLYIA
jgi:hemolysin III